VAPPVGDLLPEVLTPVNTPTVPLLPPGLAAPPLTPDLSLDLATATQTATQTQTKTDKCKPRKCDDDLEEPRTECFKGLYRENLAETEFTQWVQIDCLTGRDL